MDLIASAAATPESSWLEWLPRARAAPICWDTWMRPEARLVLLAPHPDDEVLGCGGLVAMHAARGGRCLVLAATDGEACEAGLDRDDTAQLAARRRAERAAGLERLGAGTAPVEPMDFPDARVADCEEQLQHGLRRLLRPGDVLLTTWRHDGHPDHEACGRAAACAARATGTPLLEAPVWMWHWARPGDARVPWSRLVTLALPDAVRQRKRDALAEHRSQLAPRANGEPPVLGEEALQRMRRDREHYFV